MGFTAEIIKWFDSPDVSNHRLTGAKPVWWMPPPFYIFQYVDKTLSFGYSLLHLQAGLIIVWSSRDCKFQIIPEIGRVWNPPRRT